MEPHNHNPTMPNIGIHLHSLLSRHSATCANNWAELFLKQHPGWKFGPLPDVDQQIEEINWYWRINLGLIDVDTRGERAALISHIDYETWLSNFERFIVARVVEYQLPTIPWTNTYI